MTETRTAFLLSARLGAFCLLVSIATGAAGPGPGDWPMWGRTEARSMDCAEVGLVEDFDVGEYIGSSDEIDPETCRNVKWIARLGSQTYGNPTVSGGRVFVGTNNGSARDSRFLGDRSCLYCFDEQTGKFLWQLNVPKLGTGQVSDWEQVGICSSASVEGDRAYVITNRCEVVCLDVKGLADGNEGPFQDEASYLAGPGKEPIEPTDQDADIVWVLDMIEVCGVHPHNIASSSVLIAGDRLWVTTSNGADVDGREIVHPEAPSLILVDKRTGELLAEETSGISERMFHASWSSPTYLRTGEQQLCIFGGPDGFCYGFSSEPKTGEDGRSSLVELWRVDCNAPEYREQDGKPLAYPSRGGPSEVLATPTVHDGLVYCLIGQEPGLCDGVGQLTCINPSGEVVWVTKEINRSMSSLAVVDGLLYAADYAGFIYCFDAKSGEPCWKHDTMGYTWGSPLVADGKVYIGNEDGYLTILGAGKEPTRKPTEIDMASPVYSSPVAANGVLYIATNTHLFALTAPEKK